MSIANQPLKSITISNVGPIEHLSIPVPEDGGVVVLHGSSGAGKTHAIQSVAALSDANARKLLRVQDGFPSGKIDGLGVTVRLGRSNTSKGELECHSLDSGVDPSLLVDPGIKDPVAADSKRLATLVRLAGVQISAERWSQLAGVYADDIALPDLVSDDPVKTADRIRLRLHDIARAKETIATSKATEGAALLNSIADIDLTVLVDGMAELEKASAELEELKAKRKLFVDSRASRAIVEDDLANAMDHNIDIGAIKHESEFYRSEMTKSFESEVLVQSRIASLRGQIEILEDEASGFHTAGEIAKAKYESATQRLGDAQWHLEKIAKLKAEVEIALPAEVTSEAIDEATENKNRALAIVQQSQVVARARETQARANSLIREGNELNAVAEVVRNAARSTDSVLEESLFEAGFNQVKVHDGRLCVESDRGLEPVSELSTGERWRLALDLAAKGLKKGAILTVQQEGWQSLDHDLRNEVATMAKERGLLIVTALVDGGQLRTEVL